MAKKYKINAKCANLLTRHPYRWSKRGYLSCSNKFCKLARCASSRGKVPRSNYVWLRILTLDKLSLTSEKLISRNASWKYSCKSSSKESSESRIKPCSFKSGPSCKSRWEKISLIEETSSESLDNKLKNITVSWSRQDAGSLRWKQQIRKSKAQPLPIPQENLHLKLIWI